MSFLGLHLWPGTRVVALGSRDAAESLLSSQSFKNTAHALYLAPTPSTTSCGMKGQCVTLLSRCLYCFPGGAPGVIVLGTWHAGQHLPVKLHLFPSRFEDMSGHRVRVVALTLFPFMDFQRHESTPGAPVTPLDSLDVRMLTTVADILNFTYVVQPPIDDLWGSVVDGKWTGMVATLEAEDADMSMNLFWSFARKQVIDFTRIYTNEPFIIITRKPRPLPRHLAFVRPFNEVVWVAIFFITIVLGVTLWALQRAWKGLSGGSAPTFTNSLLQAWGILLEDPPMEPPKNTNGQMLVGWWWLFCILVTATYRSSLIAHLSVPTSPPPIDTLRQLLNQRGATWGMEPGLGLGWDWFTFNQNPEVQMMFKKLKVLELKDQMTRVLEGSHAFFTWKYYIKTIVSTQYTNLQGVTPIHIGKEELIPGFDGWGVRKGLPFLPPMDRIQDHLVEAGLVDYWLQDLFESAMKTARQKAALKNQTGGETGKEEKGFSLDEDEVASGLRQSTLVLSVRHLQGAFFLLLLGTGCAFVALVWENILTHCFLARLSFKDQ